MDSSNDHVFQPWFIAMFVLGVGATLGVLFPQERLLPALDRTTSPTPAIIMFTANLLRHEPDNVQLRLLLARQRLRAGELEDAWRTVHPLLAHSLPEIRHEAVLLALRISEMQYVAGSTSSGDRQTARTRIAALIEALLDAPTELDLLPSLAESARTIGDVALARRVYRHLAAHTPANADRWFGKAGDLALSEGAYRQAAENYFAAQARADSVTARRMYYLKGLRALQAGDLLPEALVAAERHLGDLETDGTVLEFLVMLGRAAGDGEFAQKYVQRLLRLAWHRRFLSTPRFALWKHHPGQEPARSLAVHTRRATRWALDRGSAPDAFRRVVAASRSVHAASSGWRPFDDRIYSLAYDVFVENHNLTDAFELAARAVQAAPARLDWRRRLARVAEWTNRPRLALEQWRIIAEQTPDRTALERIRRLAPGVHDHHSLVFALTRLDAHGWLPEGDWEALADAFERIGRPERAVEYLIRRYRDRPERAVLQHLAGLYQRMEDSDAALKTYSRLIETYGLTVPWALEQASLHLQRGRPDRAYETLQAVRSQVSSSDATYWMLLGDLAWLLQDDATAERAYRVVWEQDGLPRDRIDRLIALARVSDPERAVSISLKAWNTHRHAEFFLRALELLVAGNRWARAGALLDDLKDAAEATLAAHPRYWTLRAEVLWRTGHVQGASEAFRHALDQNPEDSEIRAAFLWFLIEHRRLDLLDRYLRAWHADTIQDPLLWKPVAAAYLLLDRPARALPYFRRALSKDEQDYLLLLNYAQALEAASRQAEAWRIRRHAWIEVRRKLLADVRTSVSTDLVRAYMEAGLTRTPTEPFVQWIRRHALESPDAVLEELVVSWLLSRDELAAARWWLWTTYASTLDQPAWSRLMLALAENDWSALDTIIAERESTIAPHDRIVAATRLQRVSEAQTLAFEALSEQPDRHDLHALFREATMERADAAETRLLIFDRSPLLGYHVRSSLDLALGRLRLIPQVRVKWQETTDPADLVGVPRMDKWLGGTVRYELPTGTLAVAGYYRRAAASFTALRLRYEQEWSGHGAFSIEVGRNQEADDSIVLLVGGMKDEIEGQGIYHVSKRQFLELTARAARYYSQDRDRLGSGAGVEGAIGHRFRTEYPDISLRLVGQVQRYVPVETLPRSMQRFIPPAMAPTIDLVIPNDFEQASLLLSLGDVIRNSQHNGFRLFGQAGVNYNSVFGFGHTIEGGLGSSLVGHDRLTISASQLKGGFGKNATTRQFMLQYRSWF